MAPTPQTWHHGLVAKWRAEFNRDGPEIPYFQRHVERGQPALDVACGTGRRPDDLRHITLYFKNELLLMRERAGFTDVVVQADYREEVPTDESRFLVFVVSKRA
jgi:hypothetical protein